MISNFLLHRYLYKNTSQDNTFYVSKVREVFMYFNKVEISGVNTANLKVLKEAEKTRLLKLIKENGDMAAREELINGNLRLVLSVIQRFSSRGENPDDLFQVGCIGLIKAIDNFDITLNVKFSTYAVPMILGEVKRYLRDNNQVRVSRSLRDLAYRAMQAKEKLINEKSREPTIEEIAKEIEVKREDVVLALEAITEPVSLYEPVFSESGDTIYVMDQIGDNNDDNNWLDEIALKEAINHLGQREKKILNLRFFQGRTQVEVADEIGISQAQVSRLEKGALNKIKRKI
jgi:RNA polymerase sporulation-specific sigma factor